MGEILLPKRFPVLALRGLCVFPKMLVHFDVERQKSVRAIDEAMKTNQKIFLIAQKDIRMDEPCFEGLSAIGTVVTIKQVLKMPGDIVRVLVEGEYRGRITDTIQETPFLCAFVEKVEDARYNAALPKVEALVRQAQELFDEFIEMSPRNLQDTLMQVMGVTDPSYVADFIAQNTSFHYLEKQKAVEQLHPVRRLDLVVHMLAKELEVLHLQSELQLLNR